MEIELSQRGLALFLICKKIPLRVAVAAHPEFKQLLRPLFFGLLEPEMVFNSKLSVGPNSVHSGSFPGQKSGENRKIFSKTMSFGLHPENPFFETTIFQYPAPRFWPPGQQATGRRPGRATRPGHRPGRVGLPGPPWLSFDMRQISVAKLGHFGLRKQQQRWRKQRVPLQQAQYTGPRHRHTGRSPAKESFFFEVELSL